MQVCFTHVKLLNIFILVHKWLIWMAVICHVFYCILCCICIFTMYFVRNDKMNLWNHLLFNLSRSIDVYILQLTCNRLFGANPLPEPALAYYYLRHGEGYVFIVVRCLVCLSVCLSVSNNTGKRLNAFSWIFQGRWDLIQRTIGNIFRMFHFIPWTQEFLPTFPEESMSPSSIAEKRWKWFSWNFQKRTDLTQGSILNTFGMLRLTPWILGRFIYFLDPWFFFVILWKNGSMDFHEISMKRQARHKK